jgi:hydroxymethylpyrimidine/phosphomethylpyrimidine kinase
VTQTTVIERSALTISGSDSCGGAGIQADLTTFAAFGVYGASVLTAVTARNTLGCHAVEPVSDRLVVNQLEAVLADLPIRAVKIGMIPSVPGISVLAGLLQLQDPPIPLVVDPAVLDPESRELGGAAALDTIRDHLFPLATVITPNLEEAEALTGRPIRSPGDMTAAARELLDHGPAAVFLKGGRFGHGEVTDFLVTRTATSPFTHRAFQGRYHGTGCALSSAVAAGLALGNSLEKAIEDAVAYVQACLQNSLAPIRGHIALLGHLPRR